ncbi:HNH endonuclease [Streptomyces klenkii]|uniref:HNH endonuclease n=1 Tax=Streptomyces klenkii TaxID=1420899 RepID=UPI0036E38DB2
MSLHDKPHLNAAGRRARKRTLARRDGQHCTYCRTPFPDLRQATIDHVAPISLFRTWRAEHLVLACRPCNSTKANRFPLSMALLLNIHSAPFTTREHVGPDVHEPIGSVHGQTRDRRTPLDRVDWSLLARIAHARESADPIGQQSMPDLPVHPDRPTRRPGVDRGVDGRRSGLDARRVPPDRAQRKQSLRVHEHALHIGAAPFVSTGVELQVTPVNPLLDGPANARREAA